MMLLQICSKIGITSIQAILQTLEIHYIGIRLFEEEENALNYLSHME